MLGLLIVFSPLLCILFTSIAVIASILIVVIHRQGKDPLIPIAVLIVSMSLALFTLYIAITLFLGFK